MTPQLPQVNTRSVRFRTTAGAVLALVVLLTSVGIAVNWFVGREVQRSFDATLLAQATDRAALVGDGVALDALITPVGDEELVAAVGPGGQILASAGLVPPDNLHELALGIHLLEVTKREPGEAAEIERLRAAIAEAPDGIRIVVANEAENAERTRSAVRNMLLAIVPLTGLVAAAVAWRVTGRALRPVRQMRDDLDSVVHAGDGQRVTLPETRDEIDELGITINEVLERLDTQNVAQRQFVANASHELKSPLANARAIIDTASTDPDDGEYERITSAVQTELSRLHTLVDDLLFLARGDELAPAAARTFDLADVVFDEAERVAATTAKRIDASGVVPVEVVAEPADVTRAVRNLLENAERFADERVGVSISVNGGAATVVVADDGPGIPQDQRDRVFERFSRLDTDRARSAGGTGLGLSIVAQIAERHDGAVELASSPSGGAQFELTFPCPPADS